MVREVSEILGKTESGATDPLKGIVDKKQAIIKISKNPYGPRVIINEFICLEIGKLIDLSIPEGGICSITQDTDIEALFHEEMTLADVEGLCFYSVKPDKVIEFIDIIPELAEKIANKDEIIRLILFDHLIHNKDRHEGNMLLCYSNSSKNSFIFNIIDHSHVFNMQENWLQINDKQYDEEYILKENDEVYNNFYNVVNITLEGLQKEARIFKDRITKESIIKILAKIPNEIIKEDEKEKILSYLLYRLSIIDNICEFIYINLKYPGGEVNEDSIFSIGV